MNDLALRAWLIFGAVSFGIVSALVLAWPLVVPRSLGWINQKRVARGKGPLMFEPIHLIVLGLLIASCGLVWQQFWWHPAAGASDVTPTIDSAATSHYGIAWDFDDPTQKYFFLGGVKGVGEEWRIARFQASGTNVSDDFISCSRGYVRSDITGKILKLLFASLPSELIEIDQANPIPPTTKFSVVSEEFGKLFTPEVNVPESQVKISRLIDEFGGFQFIFECDKGTYKRHFTASDIKDMMARLDKSLPERKPQITRKQ